MEARVIRIVDNKRIILNVGTDDGVARGDQFAIYTPVERIVDPQTGEELGGYRHRKATIEADFVASRYTIATPPQPNVIWKYLRSSLLPPQSRLEESPVVYPQRRRS